MIEREMLFQLLSELVKPLLRVIGADPLADEHDQTFHFDVVTQAPDGIRREFVFDLGQLVGMTDGSSRSQA